MISLIAALALILLGFGIGIIASMVGVGGGIFVVPVLTLFFEFTSQVAVGTSLFVVVFTALASTYAYSRQKRIDYKVGLVSAVTSVPGAILGAYLTSYVTSSQLAIIFAVFLLFVATRMLFDFHITREKPMPRGFFWHRLVIDSENKAFEYEANVLLSFSLAFFGGLSSGLLGIGGGALMVPILYLGANLPMHVTVATSMFIMIFASLSGVATHIQLNNVNFEFAAVIAIGVILGTQIGARTAKKFSGKNLRRVFGIILIIVGINLLLKFIV